LPSLCRSSYSSSAGSRWKRAATSSTTSCTASRVASLGSATGPAITGSKEMAGSWLQKHVRMYSITAQQSLPPSASRRAPRIWSRRRRRSTPESSTGSALEMDVGSFDTGMGLTPSGTQCRARLAGPCGDALDPSTMLRLEIFKCLLHRLHCLGARRCLRRLELADPLLQRPLLLLRIELMPGQRLLPPFKHFLLEGEILLPPGEVCPPAWQGPSLACPRILLSL
jgi:hypothetical protein